MSFLDTLERSFRSWFLLSVQDKDVLQIFEDEESLNTVPDALFYEILSPSSSPMRMGRWRSKDSIIEAAFQADSDEFESCIVGNQFNPNPFYRKNLSINVKN